MPDLFLRSATLLDPESGEARPERTADLLIHDGEIARIGDDLSGDLAAEGGRGEATTDRNYKRS